MRAQNSFGFVALALLAACQLDTQATGPFAGAPAPFVDANVPHPREDGGSDIVDAGSADAGSWPDAMVVDSGPLPEAGRGSEAGQGGAPDLAGTGGVGGMTAGGAGAAAGAGGMLAGAGGAAGATVVNRPPTIVFTEAPRELALYKGKDLKVHVDVRDDRPGVRVLIELLVGGVAIEPVPLDHLFAAWGDAKSDTDYTIVLALSLELRATVTDADGVTVVITRSFLSVDPTITVKAEAKAARF